MMQRFENTIQYNNFNENDLENEKGIIISDNTDGNKLTRTLRRLRYHNPIPNTAHFGVGSRNLPLKNIILDPILVDSESSFFHRIVDVIAYFVRQLYYPNKFIRRKKSNSYYTILNNSLCVEVCNKPNSKTETKCGIVEI